MVEMDPFFLERDITSYVFVKHCIKDANDTGIVIQLGAVYLINHIKLFLFDRDNRSYSYFIEVSVDEKHWDRVVDYSQYYCRSRQFLYFNACKVRLIRLVGTHNTKNNEFHCVALEAMYTDNILKVVDGIVAPTKNVGSIEMGAKVIQGSGCPLNAMINGDYINYSGSHGYTYGTCSRNYIVLQLSQPYYIGSIRLLLWDKDDRQYSFYIETSLNRIDWEIVVDKRNELVRSWQNFTFTPRPVSFIRFFGTRNTMSSDFRIVHFECPSKDSQL